MKTRVSTIPLAGLISAEFLSLVGNQITAVAIPVLVWQHTQSTMVTGAAVMLNNLPFVLAALIGGKEIDKFGAWRLSILADILSFVSVLALPLLLIAYSDISSNIILILILAGALFDPTGVAARHTLVPLLTKFSGYRLDNVNGIRGSLENVADFIGPVIGISLISIIGINSTFFVNALSFLLSALIFTFTVPKKINVSHQKSGNDIFFGLRFIFSNSELRILALTGIVTGFVIASFLGLLLLLLATKVYHNTSLFDISLSTFSISAAISALLFSKLSRLCSYTFIYYTGLLIIGTGICLSGVAATQYGVVLASALAGAAGTGNPLEQTILQEQTSKSNAGKVFTALPAIRFAAGSLGLLATGLLTEFFDVNKILLLEGGLLIIAAALGWFIAPLKKII